jgi:Na+/alanine symporter
MNVKFENFIALANSIIWSDALIYLLLLVGVYFSLRMRFFQGRLLKNWSGYCLRVKNQRRAFLPSRHWQYVSSIFFSRYPHA